MLRINCAFFFAVLSAALLLILQPTVAQPSITESPLLSAEAAQLLEHIKTRVTEYDTQFKSGEVEFTITLSEPIRERKNFFERLLTGLRNILMRPPKEEKVPLYEEKGFWHIIYLFDGEREFYDIKARKKMELNGKPLPDWKETYHQYLVDGETLHIRERTDSGWKRGPPQAKSSRPFRAEFNPRWWSWPPHGFSFEKYIRSFDPVDVETVEINGTSYYYLRLYRKAEGKLDSAWTREIRMDVQKDYHATRLIGYGRRTFEVTEVHEDGTHIASWSSEELSLDRKTYQLTQYEPAVWFPKIVTEEQFHGIPMDKIFPDTPKAEFLLMMSETLIPEAAHKEYLTWPQRKRVMQVQRAAFNIPIAEEDLRFSD
ncbi:MAG: hypothetical protein OXU27_02430 [Candidatus Poribacteria bacterium]|nr:hypothetical protein [Candidatus Poribacteria bacterium]